MTAVERERTGGRSTAGLADWRDVKRYVERKGPRAIGGELVVAFRRNNILTYASAVAFQTLFALIPSLLAAVSVLSFLDLEEVWSETLAPRIEGATSDLVYRVIDRSVESILGTQRTFWLTLGAGLALWELSGAVRAAMGALNDVYGAEEHRSAVHRFAVSVGLAAAVGILLGVAVVAMQLVPRLVDGVGPDGFAPVARVGAWAFAVALMVLAVGLVLRFGPDVPQPAGWLGFVTVLVVVGWALASVLFAVYATQLASHGTIYSSLGVFILLLTYLYISSLVFLTAVQVDALVRRFAGEEVPSRRRRPSGG